MTEQEQFEAVLVELRSVLAALHDLASAVVLIGGQALALEAQLRTGSGLIRISTATGVIVDRGYSFEPDLLIDTEALGARGDAVTSVLTQRGYRKAKTYRWVKDLGQVSMAIDLFVPDDPDAPAPFGATTLPHAALALSRPKRITVALSTGSLSIALPSLVALLTLKADAALRLRPGETKDSFDAYALASLHGAEAVAQALTQAPRDAPALKEQLRQLFGDVASKGVRDVLTYAASLEEAERQLLAQAVVDFFAELLARA